MRILSRLPLGLRAALLVAAAVLALASTGTGTAYFSDTTANGTNRVTMEMPVSSLYWAGSGAAAQSQAVNPNRWSLAQEALGLTWSKVATGLRHTCGVTTGGKLYCWGGNSFGQLGLGDTTDRSTPTQVGTATNWEDVEAGRFHTCARATGGALSCWGSNSKGQLGKNNTTDYNTPQSVSDPNGGTWSKISLGMSHTCGINSTSKLYCWGLNSQGQLGVNSQADKLLPTQVGTDTTWSAISAGSQHTCGLQGTAARCWGSAAMYALGYNGTDIKTTPNAVAGTWNAISAGRDHGCGILNTNALQCWGAGYYGQAGTGTLANLKTPTAVVGATNWTAIQAGSMSTCALATTTLSCWGGGHSGELGLGTAEFRPSPTAVAGTWSTISLRYDHLCAISDTGALHCAGSDGYGQLGRGAAGGPSSTTWTTVGADNYTAVATSGSTTCGVGTDTKLWCWGSNGSGQLGNSSTNSSATPVQAGSATGWQSVSVGGAHACAIKSGAELWCWGRNDKGQLGDGTTTNRTAPVQVTKTGVTGWTSVSAGTMHTCAITNTDALYCFGANNWGQLGIGNQTDQTSPTKVGTATWTEVDASSNFTCGLQKSDGDEAYCWGEGVYGQHGNFNSNVFTSPSAGGPKNPNVDIAVGVAGACMDNTNGIGNNVGMLYCWGAGQWGQLGRTALNFEDGKTDRHIGNGWKKPMMAGESVCATLIATEVMYCWGDNSYGQLALGDTDDRAVTTAAVSGTSTATSLTMGTRTMFMINSSGGGSYAAAVTASSPTYYWRLNEPSGTTAAPTVGAISGTYAGSPGLGAPGATLTDGDAAVTLDGVNDYVSFGDHNDFDFSGKAAMSVEVWVKRTGSLPTGVWPRIVSKDRWGGASDRGGWSLLMEPSDTGFTPGSVTFTRLQGASAHEAHATTAMVADTWYHVVATYDGTNMKLYVNGQLESTVASALSLENNAIPLTAGGMTVSDYLQGGVDEVALYSRALGAVEIADHYAAAF